ncbi:hypothetical protein ACQEV4_42755 [Streptomyces shenzhenensis]|uniref:hypothetical protein n=1 Tax=Streptomyces shenzhenensis TaxID=943815 RepID=UPI003D90D5DC
MATLDEILVRFGVDMSDAEDETERGTQGILGRLGGMEKAGGLAAAGLGLAFSASLSQTLDATEATARLQDQLGLTDQEAERAGSLAGQVFSTGFGDSIDGVSESLGAVAQNLGGFAELGDKELVQLTKSAEALADRFQFDVAESTQAAGQLLKAGLAKDGTEAFDLLTRAAQELPPAMREELPVLTKEYAGFFQQIGATGPQMFGLLTEAAKNPLFELDKLADAVKEFTLRLADTSAVEEPLKQLGLDVGHIQKLVNTGQGTKAFDKVNAALAKVTDQTKRTNIQSALFGGPGEDMANTLKAISDSGGFAGASLDNVAGASQKVTENMQASPAQTMEAIWRTMATTIGQYLQPALQFVSDLFQKYPGLVQTLVPIVLLLATGLTIAAAAQWAMNSAVLANPYTWVVVAIVALVAAIVMLWKNWDQVTAWMGQAWDWLAGKVSGAWDWLVDHVFNPIGRFFTDTIPGWVGTGVHFIEGMWNGMIGYFASVPGRLAKGARGMWDFVSDGLKGALNGAIGIINDGIYFINANLIGNANRIPGVNIPFIPYIPFLAEGGITTGPTMAMIGEGHEQETVLPLSKLQNMLDFQAASLQRTPSVQSAGGHWVLELRGGSRAFREFFQETVHVTAGGDVIKFVEG